MKAILTLGIFLASAFMPNPSLNPGATNPTVTQSNIHKTICVSGYTAKVRPKSSYTTNLKIQQLASGFAVNGDMAPGDYEEDHLISLELGGAPSDPKNLWPEPYFGKQGDRIKDRIENKLHSLVCSGKISLRVAQSEIAKDWVTAYITNIGPIPSASPDSGQGSQTTPSPASKLDPKFATCKAANSAGYGPYFRLVNPEYFWYRDSNNDGKVC